MSFFSDLIHGNVGNLGHDLNPSNFFSDTGADFKKQPTWLKDLEIAAPAVIGTALTFGADTPLLAGLGGIFEGGGLAADTGAAVDLAAGGADVAAGGTDLLAFTGDAAAGGATAGGGALDAITAAAGPGAGLTSGAGAGGLGAAGIAGQTVGADLGVITPSTGILDTIGDTLAPIGTGIKAAAPYVGAAGLAGSLYQGYEQKKAINATTKQEQAAAQQAAQTQALATSTAAPLINQGQTLMSYLTSGTLPPQFQTQVDQTIASQKAGIIQGYASRGQPTDPAKNSALQQELAAVENSKNTLMTQLESQLASAGQNMVNTANQMLATGLSATNLEAQIPIQISKLNMELNDSMMKSISNFAAAMNGGRLASSGGGQTGTITLNS